MGDQVWVSILSLPLLPFGFQFRWWSVVESSGGDGMGSACLIETVRKIGLSEFKLCVIECIDLFIKIMTWQTLIGGGVKLAFYASSGQYVYVYSLVLSLVNNVL